MRPVATVLSSCLSLGLLVSACGLLNGCIFDKRKPVPQHTITVMADPNNYLLDGQPMGLDQVEQELRLIADKDRREATGNARTYVKIISQQGADWDRTVTLVDYCASVGLDKIETTGR